MQFDDPTFGGDLPTYLSNPEGMHTSYNDDVPAPVPTADAPKVVKPGDVDVRVQTGGKTTSTSSSADLFPATPAGKSTASPTFTLTPVPAAQKTVTRAWLFPVGVLAIFGAYMAYKTYQKRKAGV